MDKAIIDRLKHIETFYEQAPPGMVKEEEEQPEECIPDTEQNQAARDFLANAPKKGLWMPLGKEVKVMQCWRCKNFGHRTGDRECPMFKTGNEANEKFREVYEDPMFALLNDGKKQEQDTKLRWLQQVLEKSSTDESSSEDDKHKKKNKKKKKKKEDKWVEKSLKNIPSTTKSSKVEIDKRKTKKRKRNTRGASTDSSDQDNHSTSTKSRKVSKIKKHKDKERKHKHHKSHEV